ncbi:hypothetical protein EJP82_26700 [Paenibacillus anaericanus]|uniref:Uncharacterized protein n=1 Tax=Paenibacillus anaericanus TaxID=170367 RepID=A0A3S1DGJ4_9BACL|nr:hypothetical protein [Paenibacillus anaericanus]RUT38705.1 hypothetical protein EJP82_26700 [Paenibacillus anaericanus]
MKRNFLLTLLSFVMCFSVVSVSSASSNGVEAEDSKTSRIPISLELQKKMQSGNNVIIISNREELEQIAIEEGLEEVPVRIEYEYVPYSETQSEPPNWVSPLADDTTVTSWSEGHGHYDPNKDLFTGFIIDGPDDFLIEETTKKTSTYSGSFGASKGIIEASVGFTIGKERTMRWASQTLIPRGETIKFELFTTYHKVNYAVITPQKSYRGIAYDPTGVYIKKTAYATPK